MDEKQRNERGKRGCTEVDGWICFCRRDNERERGCCLNTQEEGGGMEGGMEEGIASNRVSVPVQVSP